MHTEGQQPRDGWLWGAATPVVDGNNVCLQTGRQYADDNKSSRSDSVCSLVLAQVPGRLPGKNGRLGPTEPGSAHGQTQRLQKNENWDPLTAQSGSVQTMDPTQARGQGLLDHRRECDHLEQPHHTARVLSMRSSSVILGGKKPSTNKKGCVLREPLETRKKLHAGIFGKT